MSRFLLLLILILPAVADADEIRPAYLEVIEQEANVLTVLWKVPQDPRINLQPVFPDSCVNNTPVRKQWLSGATIYRWSMKCEQEIAGTEISVAGLDVSSTDVLFRLRWLDGSWLTSRLVPSNPILVIPAAGTTTGIAATYLFLGVEHILLGIDHLLFVLALLIIIGSFKQLIITITSFTVAHSITLGMATLGYASIPQQPVEALIALSIVFVAMEFIHKQRGRIGLASRYPWIVAFLFGLLHGFGFAGALAEIGLPQQSIPLALVFFNIGVEAGQLLFVCALVLIYQVFRLIHQQALLSRLETFTTYAIGGMASFWLIDRVASF